MAKRNGTRLRITNPERITDPMAKTVKSIRMDPALWARVESYGAEHGLKTNAAAEALLTLGLERNTEPAPKEPKPSKSRAEALRAGAELVSTPSALVRQGSVHAGDLVPLAGTFERAPLAKAASKPRKWG